MNKEELEKEAEDKYIERLKQNGTETEYRNQTYIDGYMDGVGSREKRIEELKKACDETQELLDKQIEVTCKLDQENADLKVRNQELLESCEGATMMYKDLQKANNNLTKAKEILERLLITSCNSDVLNLLPNCSEVLRVRVEAEQFLSKVEK